MKRHPRPLAVSRSPLVGLPRARSARRRRRPTTTCRSPAPGSTWSQVAVDAWRADVRASGVVVNFAGTGSTDGRSQFIQATVDFANTEIPFQNPPEPGQQAEVPSRDYAYLPIVAGGTSFMYNLTVGGQRVRDLQALRRAPWPRSSPARSPAGTTRRSRRTTARPCPTSRSSRSCAPTVPAPRRSSRCTCAARRTYDLLPVHPRQAAPRAAATARASPSTRRSGTRRPRSARTASPTTSRRPTAPASIGYVEYAYAKRIDFPVVSLLNKAGYYAQPTAGNVAVALTKAKINAEPDPEPGVGLHQPGPAHLPDVELQLHGRPDLDRRAVQHRQGQDPVDVHQLLPVRRSEEGRHPRLLAAAEEPRPGRVRPGETDPRCGAVAVDRRV